MKRKIIDTSKCQGCLNCEAACVETHFKASSLFEPARNKVGFGPEGSSFPQFCRHCQKPSCVEACPSGALRKLSDGIVDHDKEKCLGCWMCVMSCPYGMAKPGSQGVMSKCDGCVAHDSMACVDACPSGCLKAAEDVGEIVEYV